MTRRLVACLACAATWLAACGDGHEPLAASCTEGPAAIERALRGAPGAVALPGGSLLSDCVRNARSDADLQNVGIALSDVADRLSKQASRGDTRAGLALGYLAGAARRGGEHTNGVALELVRRVELRAGRLGGSGPSRGGPAVRAAVRRGVAAGEARG